MSEAAQQISVAMATYNGARFVEQQLASFAAQSRLPDELIVCDDLSSDDTVALVERFAADAPFRVIVERNPERLGFAANFLHAIGRCSGDIIFLSDQDDKWLPAKVERVLAVFAADPDAMVVVHDACLTDEELTWHGQTQLGNLRKAGASLDAFAYGCCSAMRGAWARFAAPLPTLGQPLSHDAWIILMARALGLARLCPEPLISYRRHGGAATQWALTNPTGNHAAEAVRAHVLKPGSADLTEEAERNRAMLDRVRERGGDLPERLANRRGEFEAILDRRQRRIARRIALLARRRRVRWPGVAAYWLSGGYRDASGWKSALKDLVRPHG